MNIERLFFELLQIAIGNKESLSVAPTQEQWAELFALSKKQALVAISMAGMTRLIHSTSVGVGASDYGKSIGIDEMTYLKWLGLTAKVAQRNKVLNDACASLCKDLAHDGLYACILKGQSNLFNYPEKLRDCRTPGDIDVWCGLMDPEGIDIAVGDSTGAHGVYTERSRSKKYQGERGVIEWVLADHRVKGKKMPEVNYHHVDWEYKGIECEVHFKPSWMNCPWHNRRLQRWCKENEQWQVEDAKITQTCQTPLCNFVVPTVEFNAVYQLVHIYRHLFNEGIGLRQLLDYYFVLQSHSKKRSIPGFCHKETTDVLSRFGMMPFASAVMYVLQKVFAMPSEYLLCAPDAKRGEFLLNEIMLAGNFGKYDERNVIGANEGYLKRFVRRQKRFMRFLTQYPSEVIWGPYFSVKQRLWRMWNGWR